MGFARLLTAIALLAASSGCTSLPGARVAAPSRPAPSDLDSLAYARSVPKTAAQSASEPPSPTSKPPIVTGSTATPGSDAARSAGFPPGEDPYRLDSGDRLRIVVFGQDGLTNSYVVDSSGVVTMPLIKAVSARGLTTAELTHAIADRLRGGFIREPHVAIEVESYRPFFILGEVSFPGQYAFVPHMTAENAIAIAGGFTQRAYRQEIKLKRPAPGGVVTIDVPLQTLVRPGDTVIATERWF